MIWMLPRRFGSFWRRLCVRGYLLDIEPARRALWPAPELFKGAPVLCLVQNPESAVASTVLMGVPAVTAGQRPLDPGTVARLVASRAESGRLGVCYYSTPEGRVWRDSALAALRAAGLGRRVFGYSFGTDGRVVRDDEGGGQ